MKKLIAGALAVFTMAAVAVPAAEARPYRGGYYDHRYDHRHRGNGDAVAAGIAGLAIGAIIGSAASQPRYYDRSYGYYDRGYGYYDQPRRYYAPRVCVARDRVWDPYLGRRVTVERSYRC